MIFGSQKRDPCKSFYMVPNEIMRLGLSVGEIAVYNYLMYCEDHNTYQCYPSYRKMGEALGLTRKTVMKYVRSLEDRGLISTEPTTITLKSGKSKTGICSIPSVLYKKRLTISMLSSYGKRNRKWHA